MTLKQFLTGTTHRFMVTCVIGAILFVAGITFLSESVGVGGPAPADWDVNQACATHKGVQQIGPSNGYVVAVVCKDGLYISNPYD